MTAPPSSLREAMRRVRPWIAVELRPPKRGRDDTSSLRAWLDMGATLQRLLARGVPVFVTDDAVGADEEESIYHLTANLPDERLRQLLCPFLTTKHDLAYCMLFAQRAREAGFEALTVLGGDRHVGPPRCLPHAYLLRQRIRERTPGLFLGGWANPHRDPVQQAGFLAMEGACVDFALLQVASASDAPKLRALREALDASVPALPVLAGVFHYRSANPRTLDRLEAFLPVPRHAIEAHFGAGGDAVTFSAEAVAAAWHAGFPGVYMSNLPVADAPRLLSAIEEMARSRLAAREPATPPLVRPSSRG